MLTQDDVYKWTDFHGPYSKIIIMVRNPVDVAFSWFKKTQHSFDNLTRDILTQSLETNSSTCRKKCGHWIEKFCYVDKISLWEEVFSKPNVLLLVSEEFFEDQQKTLDTVLDFLGEARFDINGKFVSSGRRRVSTKIGSVPSAYARQGLLTEPRMVDCVSRLEAKLGRSLGWGFSSSLPNTTVVHSLPETKSQDLQI